MAGGGSTPWATGSTPGTAMRLICSNLSDADKRIVDSQHCVWKVPILLNEVKVDKETGETYDVKTRYKLEDEQLPRIYFSIRTTVVPPVGTHSKNC